MENVEEYLQQALSVVIFCLALIVLFGFCNNLTMLLLTVKDNIVKDNALYEKLSYEEDEYTCSYSRVISDISGLLEYDVEIEGNLIKADTYNYLDYDYEHISKCNYKKSYVFNNNKIIKIIYKKEE